MLHTIKKLIQPGLYKLKNNKELLCKSWEILSINGVQIYDTDISEDWRDFSVTFNMNNTFSSITKTQYQSDIFPCDGKYTMVNYNTLVLCNGLRIKLTRVTEAMLCLDTELHFCDLKISPSGYPAKFNFLNTAL